jgi:4,5:9,10-diseco-3-hydroxy-5,9,17-trioxoandrosta-1(10),2-diene-4-oate hydrolase
MIRIEEHFREVAGVRTYYRAAGTGHPLLLIHGVGGSSLTFSANVEELAHRFRVYALDLPGHGRSEKPEVSYAVEEAVPYIAAFIEEVCGGPAALVGVSAGGLMCALTAAAHPHLVTHLVLVSSAGLGRDVDWGLRLLSLPMLRPWLENARHDPAAVRLSLRRVLHNPALITDELVAAVCEERGQPGAGRATHAALRNNLGIFGVRRWRRHLKAMRRVVAPVMIIWGKQDRFIPVRHAHRAVRWFAGSTVHVLDRCGHWPPFEHPREFNRLVREFVTVAPGTQAG